MAMHTEKAFEDLIEESLLEQGGWIKSSAEHFVPARGVDLFELWEFLEATQPDTLKELEKIFPGKKLKEKVLDEVVTALATRGTLEVLRHGFKVQGKLLAGSYFRPAHTMNPQLLEKYKKNRVSITRQAAVNPETKESVDILLLINGLPVATIELKNPMTGSGVEDAMAQYRRRDPKLPIYRFKSGALVHFAVSTDLVYMTSKLEGKQTTFLPFNQGRDGGAGNPSLPDRHDTSYLWENVLQRDSWLDIVARFVHIAKTPIEVDGKKQTHESMVFPRYHQLEVVRDLEAAARAEGAGFSYLVQHSAGSGKSNSIAWLAHRLSSLHDGDERVFHSVVVITDRKVLDKQLQDTIFQFEHKSGVVEKIDKHSDQLANALKSGVSIIITTLQKFPVVAAKVSELPDRRYAVIIDEAHSSQGGESSAKMKKLLAAKQANAADGDEELEVEEVDDAEDELDAVMRSRGPQKNISFFAFTATPKPRTLEVFGRPGPDGKPAPFHLYSMRQAIEEHFILDVLENYTTYQVLYKLSKSTENDPEVDKQQATKQLGYLVSLDAHNIAEKTRVMVEHFQSKVRHQIGGKARAMVVTSSRRHAVRYYQAFKKLIDEKKYDFDVLVAFSGTVTDPKDPPNHEYSEVGLNSCSEAELPARFGQDPFRLLIVANKYQTGFDQPLLHTMYVDRPLRGVQAVQTLSRLNRIYPGKEKPFVLDFYNDSESIQKAFQPYYEQTVLSQTADQSQLYKLQHELDATLVYTSDEVELFAQVFYAPKARQTSKDHARLEALLKFAVNRFSALTVEEQDVFRGRLQAYVSLYGFLSQILTFQDADLEKRYSYGRLLLEELPEKGKRVIPLLDGAAKLRYYRLNKTYEGQIALKVAEPTPLPPVAFHETTTPEPVMSPLSEIIKELNERFGVGLSDADRLFFEQVVLDSTQDEAIVESATVNDFDAFQITLKKKIDPMMAGRIERNEHLVSRYFNEAEFMKVTFAGIAQAIYEMVRAKSKSSVPPPVVMVSNELPIDQLAELNKLRNAFEPVLRRFIKRQLRALLGEKWIKPILEVLPESTRDQLVGIDKDVILKERLLLSNLITVLHTGWDKYFKVLETGSPAQSVKKSSVQVLLDYVNAHREDAHAKDISDADAAAVKLAITSLQAALERHLED